MEIKDFYAGDLLDVKLTFSDYKSDVYNLKVSLISDCQKIDIVATNNSDGSYQVTALPAVTEQYKTEKYKVYYIFTKTDFQKTITCGYVEILGDINNLKHLEINHNKKVLNSILAVIEDRATVDQMNFSIQGRSLGRMPIKDLLYFKEYYENLISKDDQLEELNNGMRRNNYLLRVRFRE